MPELIINDIPVKFPFEPYEVQMDYMKRVIECLQTGDHGMLESPTGTGKTLCLLCASLGWLMVKKAQIQAARLQVEDNLQEKLKRLNSLQADSTSAPPPLWGNPKIIYSSRTHSQLTQVIAELKRSDYNYVQSAVLGSRDQMCIHPDVSKEENTAKKITMCQMMVKGRSCKFHRNVEQKKSHPVFQEKSIMDIEDLVSTCETLQCCPYYMSREVKQSADIIFMPYNYLLDSRTRKMQDLNLQGSVIILDEGHNVEKICEDSASYQIASTDVAIALKDVTEVMKAFSDSPEMMYDIVENSAVRDFREDDLVQMKTILLELEKVIDRIQFTDFVKKEATFPGEYAFEFLSKASITFDTMSVFCDMLERLMLFLNTTNMSQARQSGVGLSKVLDFIKVVYNMENRSRDEHYKAVSTCYKVFVQLETPPKTNKASSSWLTAYDSDSKPGGKIVNFWCFNPGFGMRNLLDQGVQSIIVTSGTLSPLAPLISELDIPINVTLENGHVIDNEQVFACVVSKGPDGVMLNSSFKTRSDPAYVSSLGRTILNFVRIIPEGVLVFFPSYAILRSCSEAWQMSGLWGQISAIKEIFVEPHGRRELNEVMDGYYSRIIEPGSKGACFFAVCRGKVSEGLDFSNHNGRAVILTGLPYPPFFDSKVTLKRSYLDINKKKLTGSEWYQLEATRAVNQAVGRVIRHKNDYGAILFCDVRFGDSHVKKNMSQWLRPKIQSSAQFGLINRGLSHFFKNVKQLPHLQVEMPTSIPSASKSQTAVPSFDTSSRWLTSQKSTSSQGNFSWGNSSLAASYAQTPSVSSNKPSTSTATEPQSMFSRLESSEASVSTVIDLTEPEESVQVLIKTDPPNSKRRKLKIMGVPLVYEPTTSTADETSQPTSSEPKKEDNKIALTYLAEVKKSLSKEEMRQFQEAVKSYSKESNYPFLIRALEEVFARPELYRFVQRFHIFIKSSQKQEFNSYCRKRFGVAGADSSN